MMEYSLNILIVQDIFSMETHIQCKWFYYCFHSVSHKLLLRTYSLDTFRRKTYCSSDCTLRYTLCTRFRYSILHKDCYTHHTYKQLCQQMFFLDKLSTIHTAHQTQLDNIPLGSSSRRSYSNKCCNWVHNVCK